MPDVLLFGATGFTGRLTAQVLARRGVPFAIAGRDRSKLERLADDLDPRPEVRVAAVGDVDALTDALHDVKVLATCVGPFAELGDTAVEAALRARVHYIDSTGEGTFIGRLIAQRDYAARSAGICIAPAMGFDEVPADMASTIGVEGLDEPELTLTYVMPSTGSRGTVRTSLRIIASEGPWLVDGTRTMQGAGAETRWSPLPPPIGPKPTVSFPFAEAHLAPLHLPLRSMRTFLATDSASRFGLRSMLPVLRPALGFGPTKGLIEKGLERLPEGPVDEQRRKAWTILAEARGRDGAWRNVAIMGRDVYGLTAEFLTAGAIEMSGEDFEATGVRSPVDAVGLETWQKLFADNDVSIDVFEPTEGA